MNHRIDYLGKLPRKCFLAVSGGADSMAVLDFLVRGGREIVALHFNHGTEHGKDAEEFVREYCDLNNIQLRVGNIKNFRLPKAGESPEAYWRDARYNFFGNYKDKLLITGHQLDDQVENWIFTSLRGNPRLIPYSRGNVIRPFILTKSENLNNWCTNKNVESIIDPSNFSDKYSRSYIRNNIVKNALVVNPGLYKTIKKLVLREWDELQKQRVA